MFEKYLHFSVIAVMLPAVYTGFFPVKIVVVNALCMIIYLIFIWYYKNKISIKDFGCKNIILFYFVYTIFEYTRGFFNIDGWRDYIYLYNGLFHLIIFPFWILLARPQYIMVLWKSFMTIGIIVSIILAFFPPTHGMHTMAHNMLWLNVFIFMYPYIKRKYFILILGVALFIITFDLNRRSIMLGYLIPIIILLGYLFLQKYIFQKIFYYLGVLLPLICLLLFYTKTFNIFQYLEESNKEVILQKDSGRSVFTDSRTGIYEDVVRDVLKAKEWWKPYIGLGGNGKTKVEANGASSFGFEGLRSTHESGMLNFIQHGGLLGLIAYGLLITIAAYLAMFKSRNDFMRMLGLFLVFKFAYSFIEDELDFSGHVIAQFLWIGMGYNKSFRNMTDHKMKLYIRYGLNIFPLFKTLTGKRIIKIKRIKNEHFYKNLSA